MVKKEKGGKKGGKKDRNQKAEQAWHLEYSSVKRLKNLEMKTSEQGKRTN